MALSGVQKEPTAAWEHTGRSGTGGPLGGIRSASGGFLNFLPATSALPHPAGRPGPRRSVGGPPGGAGPLAWLGAALGSFSTNALAVGSRYPRASSETIHRWDDLASYGDPVQAQQFFLKHFSGFGQLGTRRAFADVEHLGDLAVAVPFNGIQIEDDLVAPR